MSSRLLLTATFVVAVLLAGWLWYSPESTRRGGDVSPAGGREPADSKGLTGEGNDSSPFALASGAAAADASGSTVASGSGPGGTSGDTASGPGTNPDSPPAVSLLPVDITRIARAPLSDEEHEYLVQRLRDDPALLQQLIDEFRQEPDQARRDRLLQL
ncbi:MAG: hypothetical protein HKN42_04160, partial [Granulosicoccus sp.]|nr:hypothetical protein [Granulosicoccus sp.]